MGISQNDSERIDRTGEPMHERARHQGVGHIDGNRAEGLLAAVRSRNEVERLARHVAADANHRVAVPSETIDRQSNEGPAARLSRLDRELWKLDARPARLRPHTGRGEYEQKGKSATRWVPWHGTKNTTVRSGHGNPESSAGYES
jgi:hypothetical protein